MRFEIEATPTGGLRVIPFIPDVGPICQIEGRNGVGKSVALRLLELCTGSQPYARDPDSWASLRQQLGPLVVVHALELADEQTIVWRLNPAVWPEAPDPVGAWLGTAEIDGEPATLEDAQRVLRVIHHSGDLTLEGTIRERIDRDRAAITGIRDRFDARERIVGERLAALKRDLERADYDELRTLSAEVERARATATEAAVAVETARAARAAVERALALREQRKRLSEDVPALEVRELALDGEIATAAAAVRQLELRYEELRAQHRRDEAISDEIERVEEQLKGRLKRAESATERATRSAAELRLAVDPELIGDELDRVRADRDALVKERDLIDSTPRLRQLGDDLVARLGTLRAQELDEQIVARLNEEAVSVKELREAVSVRRDELSEYEPEPPAAALEGRIKTLTARAAELSTLKELVDRALNSHRLVRDTEAALAALTARLPADEAAEFLELERELRRARDAHLSLVEARALVRGQITEIVGGGAEEGERELAQLLGALEVADGDLEQVLGRRIGDLEERLQEQALLGKAVADATQAAQLARAEFDQAVAVIERSDDYGWLRGDANLPQTGLSDEVNGRRLMQLKRAADELDTQLDVARGTLSALDGALRAWAIKESTSERETPIGEAVRRHYQGVLGKEFSGKDIVEAIFDGGEFGTLDLKGMTVSWRTRDGEARTRPLAAFSSGERAFAYTRTRLQVTADNRARNTLVALDEFGAFIARDRLAQLVKFLEHDVLNTIADEVVIVLPLLRDYERELDQTTGALHAELAARVEDLRAHGYFASAPEWSTV
jgi:hypothetical protein